MWRKQDAGGRLSGEGDSPAAAGLSLSPPTSLSSSFTMFASRLASVAKTIPARVSTSHMTPHALSRPTVERGLGICRRTVQLTSRSALLRPSPRALPTDRPSPLLLDRLLRLLSLETSFSLRPEREFDLARWSRRRPRRVGLRGEKGES